MKASSLSLQLSHEELVLVLWLLNTPTIPGLGSNPFGDLPREQAVAALGSAERSLRARNLLGLTPDGRIQLDQVVVALVGTCAVPDFTMVVIWQPSNGDQVVHFFHATQYMVVEHSNPQVGVHLLQALPSTLLLQRVASLLHLQEQEAPKGHLSRIREQILRQASELATTSGSERVREFLQESGLSPQTAIAFTTTLTNIVANSVVAAACNLRQREPISDAWVFLEGENGLWSLHTVGENEDPWVELRPCSADDVRIRIADLITCICPNVS